MRAVAGELSAGGARLCLIGNGSVAQAEDFRRELDFEVELYTDPHRDSYRALGFRRGILATLGPSAARRALAVRRRGFRQTGVRGDPWQHGGTLVLAPDGRVLYAHRSSGTADHAPPGEILAAAGRDRQPSGAQGKIAP